MRRALVVLLALGMASAEGAADRPWPPGAAAASPDQNWPRQVGPTEPLVTGHQFERYQHDAQWTRCVHVKVTDGVGHLCDRPESEHGRVPEGSEVGSDPGQ